MAVFVIILMYSLWSSVFSLGKITLQYSSPMFLTGFRMFIAGILILIYLFFTNRSSLRLSGKQFLSLFLVSVFSIYLTNVLEFWGLQYLSASKTCFIYGLSPFFAVFFSYLHFKEKMNIYKWIGLSIGFIGCVPVFLKQTGKEDLFGAFSFISWPALAIIGSALFSVYGWVLFRLIVKDNDVSPIMVNGVTMLMGGCIAFFHSFLVEVWDPLPVSNDNLMQFLENALIIMVISNLICYNLYGLMLKRFTATFLSFFGLLSPVFASFSSWILLNEAFSLPIFLSSGVVAVGLWVIYYVELRQGYISPKKSF